MCSHWRSQTIFNYPRPSQLVSVHQKTIKVCCWPSQAVSNWQISAETDTGFCRAWQTVTNHNRLSPTMRNCHRLSQSIKDCYIPAKTVTDHERLSKVVADHHRLLHTSRDCHRPSETVTSCHISSMTLTYQQRLSQTIKYCHRKSGSVQLAWGFQKGIVVNDTLLFWKPGAFRGALKEIQGAMRELWLSKYIANHCTPNILRFPKRCLFYFQCNLKIRCF